MEDTRARARLFLAEGYFEVTETYEEVKAKLAHAKPEQFVEFTAFWIDDGGGNLRVVPEPATMKVSAIQGYSPITEQGWHDRLETIKKTLADNAKPSRMQPPPPGRSLL